MHSALPPNTSFPTEGASVVGLFVVVVVVEEEVCGRCVVVVEAVAVGFHWPGFGVVLTVTEPSAEGVLGGRAHSG